MQSPRNNVVFAMLFYRYIHQAQLDVPGLSLEM